MGLSGELALAAAKTYTEETVIGGGAVKGKNCTIASITEITGGHRVTFKWTLDDGTEETGTMDVMDGQGGGTSDYSALTNKPSINSVTLSGNKTTSDLGISYNDLSNKPTIPSITNCYQTTDTASTVIDNDDAVPYYNASVSGKSKILWSNIKSTLKTYFDTLYSTVTAITGLSDVNISSPGNGQVLKYDSSTSKWVNANESGGGGGGGVIDYSTVEQDTGIKWIDGKAIYQRVLDLGTVSLSTSTTHDDLDVSTWNIDTLIFAQGGGIVYKGSAFQGNVTFPQNYISDLGLKISIKISTSGDLLVIYKTSSLTGTVTMQNSFLIVQYTKATT